MRGVTLAHYPGQALDESVLDGRIIHAQGVQEVREVLLSKGNHLAELRPEAVQNAEDAGRGLLQHIELGVSEQLKAEVEPFDQLLDLDLHLPICEGIVIRLLGPVH